MAPKKQIKKRQKSFNARAEWKAYEGLQKKIDKAFFKLRSDIRKKADIRTLNKDKNELMLLLGECNYMAREYQKIWKGKQKRAK